MCTLTVFHDFGIQECFACGQTGRTDTGKGGFRFRGEKKEQLSTKLSLCSMKLCSHRLLFSVHRTRAMSSVAHRLETRYG